MEGHKAVGSWPEPAAVWGLVGSCIISWASVSPFSSSVFVNSFFFFSQHMSSISFLCSLVTATGSEEMTWNCIGEGQVGC